MSGVMDKVKRSVTEGKCAHCGHVRKLNGKEKACPKCKKPYWAQDLKAMKEGLPALVVIAVIVWVFWGGEEGDDAVAADRPPSASAVKSRAMMACRDAVTQKAKFPSKTDFPLFGTNTRIVGETVKVYGTVELMNGFGAMIPHRFMCAYYIPTKTLKYAKVEAGG